MSRTALTAVVVVAALAAVDAERATQAPTVPAMTLVDMDGREWTERHFRGRVTLVDFWATWCAPCLADLPHLKEARKKHSREEFEILGVSFDTTDRRTFVSWVNRQEVTWPQIFDRRGRQGEAARLFGVAAVPATFLVDDQGRLVARNLRGARLLATIDEAVTAARQRREGADQRDTSTSSFDAARAPIVIR